MRPWDTALITGGSTGLGAALAKALVKDGPRVVVVARNQERLDALAAKLGDHLVTIQADLSDPQQAKAVVEQAKRELGFLDLVVANAGISSTRSGAKLNVEDIVPTLQLNVVGACATLAAAIPFMVAKGKGQLLGVSSLAQYRGLPAAAAYSASKAALSTFLESLRIDLKGAGITVTDVRPGFIDTPLTRQNRFNMPMLMDADTAAHYILRAAAKKKRVVAFPWPMKLGAQLLRFIPAALYERIGASVKPEKARLPRQSTRPKKTPST